MLQWTDTYDIGEEKSTKCLLYTYNIYLTKLFTVSFKFLNSMSIAYGDTPFVDGYLV